MTTAYPLAWPDGWPRTPAQQRKSRFQIRASFDTARRKLYDELKRLGASSAVISCNLALRIDGQHRVDQSEALLADPGVAIYFALDGRPMVMASDRYETCAANLRSVGLAVEYLRGLERHGGGHMMARAFGGFAQLPPPWREIFSPLPDGLDKADLLAIVERRFRDKARTAHPDQGGSNEGMIVLNAALARAREELG